VFEVLRNIYGGKDAGRQWFLHLCGKLLGIGFKQSEIDECIFYCGKMVFVLYTDDSIIMGPDEAEIDALIEKMKQSRLDLTVEGKLADFLGVNIKKIDGEDGPEWHLTKPSLINSVWKDLRLDGKKVKSKEVPMATSKLMGRHKDAESFNGYFNYRQVIGKLNFLEQSTRGDISYAAHMCAHFCSDPKFQHREAVKWLGRYLKGMTDKRFIMHPDPWKGVEVHPDADYAGAWEPAGAGEDVDTACSRHGYIVS
jgi:hypothetical protein